MPPSYERWTVSGLLRDVLDQLPNGEWWPTGERERVTVVTDPRGWTWEVVVEGGAITALTARPHAGHRLTQTWLSAAPLGYLRDAAESYWREVDSAVEPTDGAVNVTPLADALASAGGDVGDLTPNVAPPEPAAFAAKWHSTPATTLQRDESGAVIKRISRREALRQSYRRPNGKPVSLETIDAWIRRARELKLIPPATTGRGNKRTPNGK